MNVGQTIMHNKVVKCMWNNELIKMTTQDSRPLTRHHTIQESSLVFIFTLHIHSFVLRAYAVRSI